MIVNELLSNVQSGTPRKAAVASVVALLIYPYDIAAFTKVLVPEGGRGAMTKVSL